MTAARDAARAWRHAYGIDTTRYTAGGGDHPMMDTLPAAFEAFATAQPEADALREEVGRLREELDEARDLNASYLNTPVGEWIARAVASERALAEARGMLRRVEWAGASVASYGPDGNSVHTETTCPMCRRRGSRGHSFGCALAAQIATDPASHDRSAT